MEELIFTGVQPVKKGGSGSERWFVIADSGTFSINQSITAEIWLVGGGCDGETGNWDGAAFTATGAKGGDGGYVFYSSGIKIGKDAACNAVIAEKNVKDGTAFSSSGVSLRCDMQGHTATVGGSGGRIVGGGLKCKIASASKHEKTEPCNGQNGVQTPY
ncbi:MAG: hypothetical protein NC299_18070, partial [Lachnospiraceae bacterium]|nr:hypothetical protein [Lachnospiraceae bacterium]